MTVILLAVPLSFSVGRTIHVKTCYTNYECSRGEIDSHLSQLRPIIPMHPHGVGVRAEELREWLKVTLSLPSCCVTYAPATSNEDLSPGAPVAFIFRPHFSRLLLLFRSKPRLACKIAIT